MNHQEGTFREFGEKEHYEYEGGYHEPHNDVNRDQVLNDLERWLERYLQVL